ncbi:MAG: putative Ig domain-containing protein [Synergistaceae bacterium]|nr:putative Ig domain-containing protein [Synergistaceae bacterium]
MVKKVMAVAVMLVMVLASGAWADMQLTTVHRSIVDWVDGKPDYSTARFLGFWLGLEDYSVQATQEDVNLTGSMMFSGGDYSFWDSKNGMHHISGASHSFGLASAMSVGDGLVYMPMTASGDYAIFCLEADEGMNGVNVSWNFPDKPEYSGQSTTPAYSTTQEQLAAYVPYVEYISSGSQVTGLRLRMVSPDSTSEAVTLDFESGFRVFDVWNGSGGVLHSNSWTTVEAGNPAQTEVTFDSPINESDISVMRIGFKYWENGLQRIYQWYFCKPSEPEPWLFENHGFHASLVNGKSDYSDVKFNCIFFDVQANRGIIAEAKHFTADASMTIPGGGYSLGDDNTDEELGVTIPAGTDKTFKLRMGRSMAPGDSYVEYQPIDDNGVNLHFRGGAEKLVGRTLTWTFPEELGLSGSAKVSSFKSVVQQLAGEVPYVELVSSDGKLTAVNFRMVASSDTSTALNLPYRTNFRLRFDRITSDEVEGKKYYSNWMYNTSSGTWTLDKPQDLSNMESITVRFWSWEDPGNRVLYQWEFYPAEAPAPLTITTATLPNGTVNTPYTATLSANVSGVEWHVSSGTLPAGLTLNSSTGTISGTPITAGTSTFTVTAEMPGYTGAEKQFTITISATPPSTIAITTTSLPSGTVNEPYSASLEASVSGATWSLVSGTLPAGLNLSSLGTISGTPTTAGESSFKVRAALGTATAEKDLTITVNEPEPTTTLAITTTSLPEGTYGQQYSAKLEANILGATWSISSGSLPDGLTIDTSTGEISGIPINPTGETQIAPRDILESGISSFTVRAVYASQSATKELSIDIKDAEGAGGHSGGGCSSFPAIFGAALLALILKRR